MMYRTNNYKTKCLPDECKFKTIEEINILLEKKDLTFKDITTLRYLRENWHFFRCHMGMINSVSSMHINEPSAVIFLDIKGSLYDGGTHFIGDGILGRSPLDSKPISYYDIKAFGDLISRTIPQDFRLNNYELNNDYEIAPKESSYNRSLVKRIPGNLEKFPLFSRPDYSTKYGPFTVVFISSDSVETQKNLISLLYYAALFEDKKCGLKNLYLFGGKSSKTSMMSTEDSIADIENRLLKYDNNFMRFLEYENHNFAQLDREEITEFKETINGLFFMSTIETGKTKEELMTEFLESDLRRDRVGQNYSVFALGDNYKQDGGMLINAFLMDGYGYMMETTTYGESIKLLEALSKTGINLSYLPTISSFNEFYTKMITTLLLKRENELIEAMIYSNHDIAVDSVLESSNVGVRLRKKV